MLGTSNKQLTSPAPPTVLFSMAAYKNYTKAMESYHSEVIKAMWRQARVSNLLDNHIFEAKLYSAASC